MDLDFIARLLALVERSGVGELELEQGGTRLRIVRHAGGAAVAGHGSAPATGTSPAAAAGAPSEEEPAGLAETGAATGLHLVRAGFPGTFYRAPAPGEPPFVTVGDRVADGQQLAIVEAMKTMNPIEADRAGRVAAVHVADAAPVEAGAPLFTVEPDA